MNKGGLVRNLNMFILLALLIVILIFCFLLYIYPLSSFDDQKDIKSTIIKSLIQLSLTGIIGGLLLTEYGRWYSKEQEKNKIRKELLDKLMISYFSAKKIRRYLRANAIEETEKDNSKKRNILYKECQNQVKELSSIQLEFEYYKYQITLYQNIFSSGNAEKLYAMARRMENYLNSMIKEFRDFKSAHREIKESEIIHLQTIDDFMNTKKFKVEFSSDFQNSLDLLRNDFLGRASKSLNEEFANENEI